MSTQRTLSVVLKEIYRLREEVETLKLRIITLEGNKQQTDINNISNREILPNDIILDQLHITTDDYSATISEAPTDDENL